MTDTRERICINGLWRWQPASTEPAQPPTENWGYFKVPGCWPGITDYLQKDSQTLYPASPLEDHTTGRHDRGLVRAKDHRTGHWTRSSHHLDRRIPELVCRRIRRWQTGGRNSISRGELDLTQAVPTGRRTRPHHARRGPAAQGRHAFVYRYGLGSAGEGHRAAARPVWRRLSDWSPRGCANRATCGSTRRSARDKSRSTDR